MYVIKQLAQEQGVHHQSTGDPLQNCRQANDSKLLIIWISPE